MRSSSGCFFVVFSFFGLSASRPFLSTIHALSRMNLQYVDTEVVLLRLHANFSYLSVVHLHAGRRGLTLRSLRSPATKVRRDCQRTATMSGAVFSSVHIRMFKEVKNMNGKRYRGYPTTIHGHGNKKEKSLDISRERRVEMTRGKVYLAKTMHAKWANQEL